MAKLRLRVGVGVVLALSVACCDPAASMTIWTGPTITFTRPNNVAPLDPANQDRLTDNVWIARRNTQGLFNAKTEAGYSAGSPADTLWAYGTTSELETLTLRNWQQWHGSSPPSSIGRNAVLHLVSDDIFIDIKFLSWTARSGGGFAYERSTPPLPELVGDTNGDGTVNIDDLNNVRNNFGALGMPDGTLTGDALPFDGTVNIDDLNAVRNNFGATTAAVPEPSGLALLSVVVWALVAYRRKPPVGLAAR